MRCVEEDFRMNFSLTHSQGARLREKSEKAEEGGEDSDDDDDDEISEELGYFSALDTVNPYASFKQALTSEDFLMSLIFSCAHYPFPSQPSRCKMRPCTRRPRRLLPSSNKLF
jgi:hypothetical protein